jgi:hypothetical protein
MVKAHDFAGQFDRDMDEILSDLEMFELPDEDMELLHDFAVEDDDENNPYHVKKQRQKRTPKLTIPSI